MRVFNLAQGPPAPVFPDVPASGRFPLPNGSGARALTDKQRLPTVDAWNVSVQHQLTATMSVEAAYVGNRGLERIPRRQPGGQRQPGVDRRLRGRCVHRPPPSVLRRRGQERAGVWRGVRVDPELRLLLQLRDNRYNALQTKATKRFSRGYSLFLQYTLQHADNNDGDYFFIDPSVNRGTANFDRTHTFTVSTVAELPFGRGKPFLSGISRAADVVVGGWQFNQNTVIQSGFPFNVSYRNAGEDRDTGPNRPNLVGDPDGPKTRSEWFNAAAIGSEGSAFSRPAKGTFGNLERNALRGPGYWRTDASLFKNFAITGTRRWSCGSKR